MMEARDPLAKEKEMTPMTMTITQKHLSMPFLMPEMSPYPTVVMVVTVK
jgi:hypothetical protein